jgi:virginiamycin B lyase
MDRQAVVSIVLVLAGLGAAIGAGFSQNAGQRPPAGLLVSVRGVVNDNTGKPVRGATVTAASGMKSVSRFTDSSGRYEIAGLRPGQYEVSVAAWGFGPRKSVQQISEDAEVRFQIETDWNVARLSTTDWLSFLPEAPDVLSLKGSCVGCHNLNRPVGARGLTAPDWRKLMVLMEPRGMPHLPEARLAHIAGILEKHFGPNSPVPTREQIRRPGVPDAALQATFREYATPNKGRPLSIIADADDNAWFDQGNINAIGRFNIRTETFQEYPIPTPKAGPHTLAVGRDGRVWITMASSNQLTSIDPKTGQIREYRPDTPGSPHIPAVDAAGNVWYTDNRANILWKFDPRTEKFSEYKVPVPETYPQDSIVVATSVRGEPPMPYEIRTYGIDFDSQGQVWFAEYGLGKITRFDPATEKFTQYAVPGTSSLRGLAVDADDNVWFANFLGHQLGKLNARTGEMKQFQPPTRHAAPYGVLIARDGAVWYTDSAGNHVTSFNPKTEQFVEYPVPTADPTMRFMGQDSAGRIWFAEYIAGKIGSLDPGRAAASGGTR